jgi:glycosidase
MSWLDNAVIYQILIDRFAGFNDTKNWKTPIFVGGNIKGIIDKLPYIKNMGVNAIWISPFYKGVSYHGYHVTDFYSVDKHFGDEKDLKALIESAHKSGIKVICDFVLNHCSNEHPFFIDAVKNKGSEYRDWFLFNNWTNDYQCFFSYDILPKINLDNEQARLHLLDAARKWLGLGFDGFRIDHIIGVSNENLNRIFTPIKVEFPNAVFIGEAWLMGIKFNELDTIKVPNKYLIWLFHLTNSMYRNYANILDGILDFKTAKSLEKLAMKDNEIYKRKILRTNSELKRSINPVTFLDNHDMERFLFRCGGNVDKLKRAADLQFSLKGPTIIYYGTEIGMSQDKPFSSMKSYSDLLAREPMKWNPSKQDIELSEHYKKIIKNKLTN